MDNAHGIRIAVNGLVNAVSTYQGQRLVLIMDDLHRVNDRGALNLLDNLINQLPIHCAFIIGSRIQPNLSLPRWRANGELGEILTADLQFNEHDAMAFGASLFGKPIPEVLARQALKHTKGWAAGLNLVFSTANNQTKADFSVNRADRHLFDYFAAEVLADLPTELREFLLHCSILPELDPHRCKAVTGLNETHLILDELYRRNLFLTALDDMAPVLKLHDLFRDYLKCELELRYPGLKEELHAKAAVAEPVLSLAIMHWLKAKRWDEAVTLIQSCSASVMAEGGYALLERWLNQLPEHIQNDRPEVAQLKGMCKWAHYDSFGMREHLELACVGYRRQGDTVNLAHTLFMLGRSLHSVGALKSCSQVLQEANKLKTEFNPQMSAAFHSVRASQALAIGRSSHIAPNLQAMIAAAEQDLHNLFPAISDVFNVFLYGMPNTLQPLCHLRMLCSAWSERENVHWMVEAMANTAWPEFWHGDYATTLNALERQSRFQQRMAAVPALWLDFHQLNSRVLAAQDDFEQAIAIEHRNLQIASSDEFGALALAWRRPILFNLACVYWMAQDTEGLAELMPHMWLKRQPEEWPFVATGLALVKGRHALLSGNLPEAEIELVRAKKLYRHWRCPGFTGNPSISLAHLRAVQGQAEAAWAEFKPVLQEAVREDSIGPLLMEPRQLLTELFALIPPDKQTRYLDIQHRLEGWQQTSPLSCTNLNEKTPHNLSERELEVLERIAAGDCNKQIAKIFNLSPHTVKRHVSNILNKLDLSTRGQAAAWWRQHIGRTD
ncbi:LuxR C-terminal-related transcriptional regulator [Methylotuvimicrobium sp. KM2]|uniref:LuxR C-terminal-related transcriptional regulator n=1 Tax=Methylotuvimicrobium sp. KM2 TaxID=3133976 RepID=UPI0031011346